MVPDLKKDAECKHLQINMNVFCPRENILISIDSGKTWREACDTAELVGRLQILIREHYCPVFCVGRCFFANAVAEGIHSDGKIFMAMTKEAEERRKQNDSNKPYS